MDNRIRRHEFCVIGLPQCDFAFSSTRTCFIAYGFAESKLEMTVVRNILEKKGIQPVEAGGALAPGQSAFCAKICSKIITSQFCIVLLNNEVRNGKEVPNANVNMEYGLMLGFNKYVIPFQRAEQRLPFNVAGLDTIKYTPENLESQAQIAINQAVETTRQDAVSLVDFDQRLHLFLTTKKALITSLTNDGDKSLYMLCQPLGFNLINDFSGMNYLYLGNFPVLRSEIIIWRLQMLRQILDDRRASIEERVKFKIATDDQANLLREFLKRFAIWIIVTSAKDKVTIKDWLLKSPSNYKTEVFSIEDIDYELAKIENLVGQPKT